MNSPHSHPSALSESSAADDWRALQYVLGELTAEDVAHFEARLADDVTLADAVVRAVGLIESLHAVKTGTVKPVAIPALGTIAISELNPIAITDRRSAARSRRAVMAVTAVAALLLIGLLWPSTPAPSQSTELLVSYWRTSATWNEHDLDWPQEPTDADVSEGTVVNEAGVPNWLMLAVSADKAP